MPEHINEEQAPAQIVNNAFQEGPQEGETLEAFFLRLAQAVVESGIEDSIFLTKGQEPKAGFTPQS